MVHEISLLKKNGTRNLTGFYPVFFRITQLCFNFFANIFNNENLFGCKTPSNANLYN
jgi:hypothetical protein